MPSGTHLARMILLAAAYTAAALLGLRLDAVGGFATLVWAPTGLSLAALVLQGRSLWPGVALGAFLSNFLNGATVPVALGIAGGNTAEAVLGAWALVSLARFHPSMTRLRDVVGFVLAAAGAAVVSATIGTASLYAGGVFSWAAVPEAWRAWVLGDVIGALVVGSMLFTWGSPLQIEPPGRRLEALALAGAIAAASILLFGPAGANRIFVDAYLPFPLLMWAAVRFEARGATAATFGIAVLAIVATGTGRGPFATLPLHDGLLRLQLFMTIASASALSLAAVSSERGVAQRDLGAAVRARDEFVSVASHELRTPLNALVLELDGLSRMASGSAAGATVASIEPKISRAVRQTRRLTRLVESLLDLSRLQRGAIELHPEQTDLAELAREVVERMTPEAQRANTPLEIAAQPATSARWDPLRLEQVVNNLLSNAIKYGAGKPVRVEVRGENGTAHLVVRDHGGGIPPADRERVFERFARLPGSHGLAGLGLGLYITRQIVEAHGGRVRIEAPEDGGSRFVVELPL